MNAEKKKRPKIVTILAILLLLVGLGIMLYPTFSDLYYRWTAQQQISQYNHVAEATQADYSELWAAAEEYNRQLAQRGSSITVSEEEQALIEQLLNPLGNGMMGYIDIPKISVHLPIYQDTEESALQAGAGFWLGTSLPTGGPSTHCVLTAHNGLVRAKMFTDLDQLEIGDTFSLSILDRVLTYEVDQILVTEPEDISPLQIVEGEDYVTLYTCTPYGVNTHRLLVRGHRIPTPEDEETVDPVQAVTGGMDLRDKILTALFLVAALLLLILAARLLISQIKKAKQLPEGLRKEEKNKNHEENQ
ncbi:MAG TPA: class C sortase [Candidatus Egerieicola pullicola]|uniref:Class C sortase n=1 Tax=Candidatus Egerieicola pullicola TaxID=2840775 RepID=A0A9D1ALX5_9FIRM|nr:class C sortase [Candidatus Egerieicola pullicola]